MSLLDFLRQEYLKGIVLDKYQLRNGNMCLIVEDNGSRYHVEFKDNYSGPCLENLFGIFSNVFAGQTEQLEKLIQEGDFIELTSSYGRTPFREAYRVHSVSRSQEDNSRVVPLRYGTTGRY